MGLGPQILKTFLDLKNTKSFDNVKSVIEIGSTDVFCEQHESAVEDFLKAFGVNPDRHLVDTVARQGPARLLFETVGFKYCCIDFDGHHGALQMDLNWDSVPPDHFQKYDLVMNLGTTEHVMNQFNVFKVIHDLTKPGGYMLHELPFLGFPDHGLFIYSARFFWDLCRENNYGQVRMDIEANPVPYALPENIKASFVDPYSRVQDLKYHDAGILAVLKKAKDREFVCPVDMSDANYRPPASYGSGYGNFLEECSRLRLSDKLRIIRKILTA
ncbi:MAG: methyltransferase domain-containing protein [Desulfomonile tiedjei]|nr:methyltransferase domain-containing protein [Desulfomonile tiedjei]